MPNIESKLSRWLRWHLYVSFLGFIISLGIIFIFPILGMVRMPRWLPIAMAVFFISSLLSGLANFGTVLFTQLQARLSEWMATFFIACTGMGMIMYGMRSKITGGEYNVVPSVMVMLVIFGGSVLGSIWGWTAAKRLNEMNGKIRFGLLLKGWLLILGMAGGALFILWLSLMLVEKYGHFLFGGFESDWWIYFGLSTSLALPALKVEWTMKRKGKSNSPS